MRLIDADALLDDCIFSSKEFEKFIREFIGDAPTIDSERRKGKWIRCENPMYSPFDDSDQYTYRCTVCYKKNDKQTKYCPNCGAKMNGEGDDNAD